MKTRLPLFLVLVFLFTNCQPPKPADAAAGEGNKPVNLSAHREGMIKLTVMYPNQEGKTFDMDYYENKHFPLVASLLGDALKGIAIEKGVASAAPGQAAPYVAIGHLYFESIKAFEDSFGPALDKIRADVPNYTTIEPIAMIVEVVE